MNFYKIIICFMLLAFNSQAQDYVKLNALDIDQTTDADLLTLTLPFEIEDGYHLQPVNESLDGSIPTTIMFKENENYLIANQYFSSTQDETLHTYLNEHSYLADRFEVTVTLNLVDNTTEINLEGELEYQACTGSQCRFPRTLTFQTKIN